LIISIVVVHGEEKVGFVFAIHGHKDMENHHGTQKDSMVRVSQEKVRMELTV
jgi:hypothetical protein